MIIEQEKDQNTRIVKPLVIKSTLLKKQRKEATRALRERIRTTKGKRTMRYALIRFMDDIGVPRVSIAEVFKVSFRAVKRAIYEKNAVQLSSSEKSQNVNSGFSNSDERVK